MSNGKPEGYIVKMLKWIKNFKSKKMIVSEKKETRLEQMKKNPYKRVDSENMTDIEKMDQGFNGKTFTINGIEVDFLLYQQKILYFAFT